jgi:signal transduction histidine kinase/YHS domain-containing protein
MHDLMPLCVLGLALLIASNLWTLLRVLRPLRLLARQSAQIAEGNLEALDRSCGGIGEIDKLRRAMAGMVGHVRRSQLQTRAYADALAEGQEAERARIARELHDETVQALIAISQSIDLAQQLDGERGRQRLQVARTQAVESAKALRNLIADLRPPALEELGLAAAIQMLVDGQAQVRVHGIQRRLPPVQELALFRGVQEALNNARRHSQAETIEVSLTYEPACVSVHITDNGRGFQVPPEGVEYFVAGGHYGLMGIRERLQHLGGDFKIDSAPGKGTTVTLSLPSQVVALADVVRDPVCSTWLQPEQAYGYIDYEEKRYYFCCPVCQGAFQREPEAYLRQIVQ